MPLHANLTGADLHEPKGVDAATANKVYVSNGSGSGAWSPLSYTLVVKIDDVTSAQSTYVSVPYAGNVVKVSSVIHGAISGSDETVTCYNASGVSMGTLTITHTGSAAGDVDTLSPVANNSFSNNTAMRITSNGDSTGTTSATFTIVFERT